MKLYTTEDEYRKICADSEEGRSRTVALSRKLVRNLILDHTRMAVKLDKLGEGIEKGKPKDG
jgi:hypothetical protein|tara:strand:+ start:197 stop:382 length:186 start_codon:yes stop_codon:yes gene_type:complete